MTDFSKLEARLDAALGVLAKGGKTSEIDAAKIKQHQQQIRELREQLSEVEKERDALLERIAKASEQLTATRARVGRLRDGAVMLNDTITAKDKELETVRAAHIEAIGQRDKARGYAQQLKESNVELRKANEAKVGDPDLINKTLERDMEQMQAQHENDLEEVNAILARLTPLVEGN